MNKKHLNRISEQLILKMPCKYSKATSSWEVVDEVLPIYYVVSLTEFSKSGMSIISGVNISVFSKPYDKWRKCNFNLQREPVWIYGIKLNDLIDESSIEFGSAENDFNRVVLAIHIGVCRAIELNFNLEKCILLNNQKSKALGKNTKIFNDLTHLQKSNIVW